MVNQAVHQSCDGEQAADDGAAAGDEGHEAGLFQRDLDHERRQIVLEEKTRDGLAGHAVVESLHELGVFGEGVRVALDHNASPPLLVHVGLVHEEHRHHLDVVVVVPYDVHGLAVPIQRRSDRRAVVKALHGRQEVGERGERGL